MTAKPGAERQREFRERRKAERQALRAAGLVRVEEWCHPDDETAVRAYVQRLARKREKGKT